MELTPSLIDAYRRTIYRVDTGEGLVAFRVGELCLRLDPILDEFRTRTAVFVTAYNPFSVRQTDRENASAQHRLCRDVALDRHLLYLTGFGEGDDWREDSIFIIGGDIALLLDLVARYRQHAAVLIERGKPPELVLAPQADRPAQADAPSPSEASPAGAEPSA